MLELLRAEIAQSGVETAAVVDLVDESWKVVGEAASGRTNCGHCPASAPPKTHPANAITNEAKAIVAASP